MRREHGLMAREELASAHMAHVIREAFCGTLRASGLPSLAVLELAAVALGVVYREVAAAHDGITGCRCGWTPDEEADIHALRTALALGAIAADALTLRTLQPLGRA